MAPVATDEANFIWQHIEYKARNLIFGALVRASLMRQGQLFEEAESFTMSCIDLEKLKSNKEKEKKNTILNRPYLFFYLLIFYHLPVTPAGKWMMAFPNRIFFFIVVLRTVDWISKIVKRHIHTYGYRSIITVLFLFIF